MYRTKKKRSSTGYIKSQDQTTLFYRYFPVSEPKALVLVAHGFAEHSGRYLHVIEQLRDNNFSVLAVDFRGHGYSHGDRGYIEDFSRYEEDLFCALKMAKEKSEGQKIFLLAHSMGAMVAIRFVAKHHHSLAGLVLSSPLVALKSKGLWWKKAAVYLVAFLLPKLKITTGIKGKHISSVPNVRKMYDEDPLIFKKIPVISIARIIDSCGLMNKLSPIKLPTLIQLSGNDLVVNKDMSKKWFSSISKKNKEATLKEYENFWHEIYNEANGEIAIKDMLHWLNERLR